MRLLNTKTLEMTYFRDHDPPPYAILSHRWEAIELTLEDWLNGRNREGSSWHKIKGACHQACEDALQWIWMDTICIDKTSSAELSEAINSMYRWYAQADICYAFLSDVRDLYDGDRSSEEAFAETVYFTRGWTLQELLAPREVVFYDVTWTLIARRSEASQQIARRTGIDVGLLEGLRDLSSYSVAQKLSWAAERRTTRPEDEAYCLIGLFGVNMPLLYGEGRRAFVRLQEEILKSTADLSILAWSGASKVGTGPLASGPSAFAKCSRYINQTRDFDGQHVDNESAMTNVGLRINVRCVLVPASRRSKGGLAMLLDCHQAPDFTNVLALKLTPTSANGEDPSSTYEKLKLGGFGQLNCFIGWLDGPEQDRTITIDVLEAAEGSIATTIMIRQGQTMGPARLRDRQRGWTHLWLRFEDPVIRDDWRTINMYPRQHWQYQSRIFDLVAARRDQLDREERLPAASRTLVFGLPLYGAIALRGPNGFQVAIYFCQKSPSVQDGISFELQEFIGKSFQRPDDRLLERTSALAHSIRMTDGAILRADISLRRVSGCVVAHIALTVVKDDRPTSTVISTGRQRTLLDFFPRHREASGRDDSNARIHGK